MDPAFFCAAAGEDRPLKPSDVGLTGESGHEMLKFQDEKKDPRKVELVVLDPKKEEPVVLDPKKEEPVVLDPKKEEPAVIDPKKEEPAVIDPKKEEPAVIDPKKEEDLKEEDQVTGWNPDSGHTIRRDQQLSQDRKSEQAAAKKGLGYLCYNSHGAMKPKF